MLHKNLIKPLGLILTTLLTFVLKTAPAYCQNQAQDLTGTWKGELSAGNIRLEIETTLIKTIDSIYSGVNYMTVRTTGSSIIYEQTKKAFHATYDGRILSFAEYAIIEHTIGTQYKLEKGDFELANNNGQLSLNPVDKNLQGTLVRTSTEYSEEYKKYFSQNPEQHRNPDPSILAPRTIENKTELSPSSSTYRVVARTDGITEQVIDGFKIKSFVVFKRSGRNLAIAQTGQVLFDAMTDRGRVTFLDNKAVAFEGMQIGRYTISKVETEVALSKNGNYGFTALVEETKDNIKRRGNYMKPAWWVVIINGNIDLAYDAISIPREKAPIYFLFWRSPIMFNDNGDYVLFGIDGMKRHSVVKGQIADESVYDSLSRQQSMFKPFPANIVAAWGNAPYDQLLGLKPFKTAEGKTVYDLAAGSIYQGGLQFTDNGQFAFQTSWKFNLGLPDNMDHFGDAIIAGHATATKPNYPKILPGDLIVYWQGENAIHVGLIETVNSETSIIVRSKWGPGAVYDHMPDFVPYTYDNWSIYRRKNLLQNYSNIDDINQLKTQFYYHCGVNKLFDLVTDDNRDIIQGYSQNNDSHIYTDLEVPVLLGGGERTDKKGKAKRVPQYYPFTEETDRKIILKNLSLYDCRGFVFAWRTKTMVDQLAASWRLLYGDFFCVLDHSQVHWIIEDGYNKITDSKEFNSRK